MENAGRAPKINCFYKLRYRQQTSLTKKRLKLVYNRDKGQNINKRESALENKAGYPICSCRGFFHISNYTIITAMDDKTATMLYDGDCGFCMRFIKRWQKSTGDKIRYEPYQEALPKFPQVTEKACQDAVQLILPDGSVLSGAHAVFAALGLAGRLKVLHWLYEYLPLFGRISELIYQWIAHHRLSLSRFFVASPKKCG